MIRTYLARRAEEKAEKKIAEAQVRYEAAKLRADQVRAYNNSVYANHAPRKKALDTIAPYLIK